MERYLAGEKLHRDELRVAMRKGVVAGRINPVLVGSALRNKGVQRLLDAVCYYLPCPLDITVDQGLAPGHEGGAHAQRRRRRPTWPRSRSRSISDKNGDLTFVRVYSGTLAHGRPRVEPHAQRPRARLAASC